MAAELPPSDDDAVRARLARTAPGGPLLIDHAETARTGDWSLRSALVRFAQPEPVRAGAVLEVVRRTDAALHPHRRLLESVGSDVPVDDPTITQLLPVLGVALLLDGLADVLAGWAAAHAPSPPPVELVDAVAVEAHRRLDAAGVPREQRPAGR